MLNIYILYNMLIIVFIMYLRFVIKYYFIDISSNKLNILISKYTKNYANIIGNTI